MLRLVAAAILALAAVPAMACDWNKSAATDSQPSTVASQPACPTCTTPTDSTTPSHTDSATKQAS